MEVDEIWAYRASSRTEATPVRIVKIGVKKPARVLCRFENDSFEGKQDWLIPGRLFAPWEQADAFLASERELDRLVSLGRPTDSESMAIDFMEKHFLSGLAEVRTGPSEWGMLDVPDPAALAAAASLSADDVIANGWAHDNLVTVPMPTTVDILAALAKANSRDLLQRLKAEEDDERRAAANGRWTKEKKPRFIEPVDTTAMYDEFYAPYFDLLREWAGDEAVSQADDISTWKREAWRLYKLLDESIDALRKSGQEDTAFRLYRELFSDAKPKTWATSKVALAEQREARLQEELEFITAIDDARAVEYRRRHQELEAELWSASWTPKPGWYH